MSSLSTFIHNNLSYDYNSEEFTSGGTFDVPDDVSIIFITGCAAGGGGGGGDTDESTYNYGAGGGGSGEHCFQTPILVTPGESITVTIGAGGSGGTGGSSPTDGSDGNDVIFGDYLTLSGGLGGKQGITRTVTSTLYGYGGDGGGLLGGNGGYNAINPASVGGNGKITIGGSGGGQGGYIFETPETPPVLSGESFPGGGEGGTVSSAATYFGASGAGSFYGDGGDGGTNVHPDGTNGTGYGAGGGGGATDSTAGNGGDGSDGYLLVEWF